MIATYSMQNKDCIMCLYWEYFTGTDLGTTILHKPLKTMEVILGAKIPDKSQFNVSRHV